MMEEPVRRSEADSAQESRENSNEEEEGGFVRPPHKIEASRFSRPKDGKDGDLEKSVTGLKLLIDNLQLCQYGGLSKKILIRPGGKGTILKPKQFIGKSQRISRKKKLGIRVSYNKKDLILMKPLNKEFPLNCDLIEGIFEEGLGIDDTELDRLVFIAFYSKDDLNSKDYENTDEIENRSNIRTNRSKPITIDSRIDVSIEREEGIKERMKSSSVGGSGGGSGSGSGSVRGIGSSSSSSSSDNSNKTGGKKKWIPPALRGPRSAKQLFRSRIGFLLNKVTLDNFETIKKQLIDIFVNEVTKVDSLQLLVSLIFDKTINDPLYGPLYAQLCVELSSKEKLFEMDNNKSVGFKNVLVEQCEIEFNKGHIPAKIEESFTSEDIRLAQLKQKNILMGTMKFIGELYVYDLLRSNIITHCLKELLHSKGSEMDIEAACNLLETVGKKIDSENLMIMRKYYSSLTSIQNNTKKYNARIRILVRNLLDFRRHGWKSDIKKQELKTSAQVRAGIQNKSDNKAGMESDDVINDAMRLMAMSNGDINISRILNENNIKQSQSVQYQQQQYQQQQYQQQGQQGQQGQYLQHSQQQYFSAQQQQQHGQHRQRSNIKFNNINNNNNNNINNKNMNSRSMVRRRYKQSQNQNQSQRHVTRQLQNQRQRQRQRQTQLQERPFNSFAKERGNEMVVGQSETKSRFLMKSKKLGLVRQSVASVASVHNVSNISNIDNVDNTDNVDNMQVKRPCMDGEKCEESKLDAWLNDYLLASINVDEFLNKISKYKLDRNEFLETTLRKALDRDTAQQERTGLLYVEMFLKHYILQSEFEKCFEAFFEYYTLEISDIPKLASELSLILSILIFNNILNLKHIRDWIKLDKLMSKKAYKKSADKNLTYLLEFIAQLLRALRDQNLEDSDYVSNLLRKEKNENGFDLESYFVDSTVKQKWIDEWMMKWLN